MTGDSADGTLMLDADAQYHHGRPGNYYLHSGTWLRSKVGPHRVGVVYKISEVHDSGTVVIQWYPDARENVSVLMLVEKLRKGRYEVLGSNEEELPAIVSPELEEKRWGVSA